VIAKVQRNRHLLRLRWAGAEISTLKEIFGLSTARVHQIRKALFAACPYRVYVPMFYECWKTSECLEAQWAEEDLDAGLDPDTLEGFYATVTIERLTGEMNDPKTV